MDPFRGFFSIWITIAILRNVDGRYHFHKGGLSESNSFLQSPAYAPGPNDPGDSTPEPCVFDVTDFGAVGDGSTDDTTAFRAAWKEACAVESAVLLAPADYTFTITSTIFSGPCKPGLVFQVNK